MQIVNGGQTLRTIYKYIESNPDTWYTNLINSKVLAKIIKTGNEHSLKNDIARFTNSQNPVKTFDLRSLDPTQILLEQFLNAHGIAYLRKSGDYGIDLTIYEYEISMIKLAQIIFSYMGNPDKASSQRKRLFDKFYEDIFHDQLKEEILEKSIELINDFRQATIEYQRPENESVVVTDQKIFYLIYLKHNFRQKEFILSEAVKFIEDCIESFPYGDEISDSRKLIKGEFKTYLSSEYLK